MLAAFLYIPFFADLLDQAGPTWAGFAIALLAIPAVIAADTLQKVDCPGVQVQVGIGT